MFLQSVMSHAAALYFCYIVHCEFCLHSVIKQPKKIEEIKDFLITARRKDAKCTS